MSSFFSKNRQSSSLLWQKKQTAINSHNDRFTIYAHMHPQKSKSIIYTQNSGYPRTQNSQLIYEDNQSSEVPINHNKISKMKQTLKNLQLLNNNQSKYNVSTELRHYSNPNSVQNSRNIFNNQIYDEKFPQQNKDLNLNELNNIEQDNYNEQEEMRRGEKKPQQHSKSSMQRSNYQKSQPSSKMSYNDKLDIMKQRLALICKKQYTYKTEIPQNYNYQKHQLISKQSKKNLSQLSTKRQQYYKIKNKDKDKDYVELLGKVDRNSELYKEFKEISSNNSSANLHKSKNTVPMPKIIHEDEYQGQDYIKISATMEYPPGNHFQHKNNSLRQLKGSKQKLKQNPSKSITQKQGLKPKDQMIKSKKNQPMSTKKQQQYYYWQLYPNLSEQLDMKIQKQRRNQQNILDIQTKYQEELFTNNKLDKNNGLNYISKPIFNKPNKSVNNYQQYRGSENRDHPRNQCQNMREQLDKLKSSVWLGVYPTYNEIHQKYTKSINEGYRGSSTHSNQATKRRESSNSIYIPPASKLIKKQQQRQRSNTSRSLSRSANKNQISSQNNINGYRNKNFINKNNNNRRLYDIDEGEGNANIIKFGNNKQSDYQVKIISDMHQMQENQNQPNFYYNPTPLSHPHRAMIKQIIIGTSTNLNQNQIQLYTASNDYKIKYHIHNQLDNSIKSWDLYTHRGSINSLMKIDSLLFSVSNDLYLKFSNINHSIASPIRQNQSMYRMSSKPMHLACVDQANIIVGCNDRLCLFNITKSKIVKQIFLDLFTQKNYSLLQNGHNQYIGDNSSLYLLDYRSNDSLTTIASNLGNVQSWIMHPTQQFFIIQKQAKLLQLQFKSTKKQLDNKNFLLNRDTIQLEYHKKIVSSCWRNSTISQYNSNYNKNGTLALLFQQKNQNDLPTNQLFQWTISNRTNQKSTLKQVNMGSKKFIGTLANSMNIVREWNGRYYTGDRNGNIYNFVSKNQNGQKSTTKKANASLQRKKANKNQLGLGREYLF